MTSTGANATWFEAKPAAAGRDSAHQRQLRHAVRRRAIAPSPADDVQGDGAPAVHETQVSCTKKS